MEEAGTFDQRWKVLKMSSCWNMRLFMEATRMLTRGVPDSSQSSDAKLLGPASWRWVCDKHKCQLFYSLWSARPHTVFDKDGRPERCNPEIYIACLTPARKRPLISHRRGESMALARCFHLAL